MKSQEHRKQKEIGDEIVKEIILKAFNFKNRKKGARQIKMTLAGHFNIVFNLKRIRRIMKKISHFLSFPKGESVQTYHEGNTWNTQVVPNLLKRQFNQGKPGKVLLTDIT